MSIQSYVLGDINLSKKQNNTNHIHLNSLNLTLNILDKICTKKTNELVRKSFV